MTTIKITKKTEPPITPLCQRVVLDIFLASALLLILFAAAVSSTSATGSEKCKEKARKYLVADKEPKKKKQEKRDDETEARKHSSDDRQRLDKLVESAQDYKENPSNETYTELWKNFEDWISHLAVKHIDAQSSCQSCQILAKAGLKVIDATGSGGSVKVYAFSPRVLNGQNKSLPGNKPEALPTLRKPEIKPLLSSTPRTPIETRDILIQWTELGQAEVLSNMRSSKRSHALSGTTKRSRLMARRRKGVVAMHTQSMNIPANVEINQVCSVTGSAAGRNRFLALIGQDVQSGHSWFEGLRYTSSGWLNYPDLWQEVPSFLLQTGQSKVRFSNSNLVINIGNHSTSAGLSGYELIMPFVENHFALMRNEAQNPAREVALQFLLAVQSKRPDLVKIWLSDPQLASIPGYLGLYNRTAAAAPLKLINMSSPLSGGGRFRVITNTKDDLIVDVAKVKGQWMVKALFIAPADSLAREISHILPNK